MKKHEKTQRCIVPKRRTMNNERIGFTEHDGSMSSRKISKQKKGYKKRR